MSGITIEVNDAEYTEFVSAEVSLRLDALTDTFAFEATSKTGPLPFLGGETCVIKVDGEQVLNGFIEVVHVSGSSSDHTINIEGRDRTADFLDSSIDVIDDLRAPMSLKQIISDVIDSLYAGQSNSELIPSVSEDVVIPQFTKAEDITAPEPGQNAFAYIEPYLRKRQVLLTSTPKGDMSITASSGTRVPKAFVQHVLPFPTGAESDANNVTSYTARFDSRDRFNKYISSSQRNVSTIFSQTSSEDIVNQKADATDDDIRIGRQMVIVSETPTSSAQGLSRAQWEANIRKARGNVYSPEVHGFRHQGGELWTTNTLIPVFTEYAGIDSDMLLNAVRFTYSRDNGSNAALEFLPSSAYTLTLDEPVTEKVSVGFFGQA